jgi:hypothetical protein
MPATRTPRINATKIPAIMINARFSFFMHSVPREVNGQW